MATADLVIGNGITNKTISVSDSTPMIQRAQDATTAILAAFAPSTQTFKVVWGFRIVAGFNDRIIHAANLNGTATNVTTDIPAGNYTSGAALAATIQTAMQATEDAFAGGKRVNITVTYNSGTGKFNWAWTEVRATISQFIIRGSVDYSLTALVTVGIQQGCDQVGAGASGNFDADYETRVNRFKFAFAGAAGSVRLADAAFTAESFFGITDTTNQTILAYLCNQDMLDPPPPPPPPSLPAPARIEPKGGSVRLGPYAGGMLRKTMPMIVLDPGPRPTDAAELATWTAIKAAPEFMSERLAREWIAMHVPGAKLVNGVHPDHKRPSPAIPRGTIPVVGDVKAPGLGLTFNTVQHGPIPER
jgi:hypothetical protein